MFHNTHNKRPIYILHLGQAVWFPLVPRKDCTPDDCMIDNIVHFGDEEVNEDNDPDEMQGLTTPLFIRNNAARSTFSTKLKSA